VSSLRLAGAPKVIVEAKYRSVQKVKGGNAVTLQAEVTGCPMPTVTWLKDNKPVTSASVDTKSSGLSTMTVSNASRENSGIYKVVAENSFGKDTAEIEVTVTGAFFTCVLRRE